MNFKNKISPLSLPELHILSENCKYKKLKKYPAAVILFSLLFLPQYSGLWFTMTTTMSVTEAPITVIKEGWVQKRGEIA